MDIDERGQGPRWSQSRTDRSPYPMILVTGVTANIGSNVLRRPSEAGVDHVEKLSAGGTRPTPKSAIGRRHHEAGTHLKASGLSGTELRPTDNEIRTASPATKRSVPVPR